MNVDDHSDLDGKNVCSWVIHTMDKSTVALSVATVGLVGYVLYEHTMSGDAESSSTYMDAGDTSLDALDALDASSTSLDAVGMSRKARRRRRQRLSPKDCANVSIDSPDFVRCSPELGTARTVLPGDPTRVAHNINRGFVNDSFTPQGAAAFPFTARNAREGTREGGKVRPKMFDEYGKRFGGTKKKSNPLMFKAKGGVEVPSAGSLLGAAVSPSAMGASREEILQSTKVAVPLTVESNTGGQLNLLHPLE